MMKTNSEGFHIVEVLLVVAIVAVLGFVGWRVWDAQTATPAAMPEVSQELEAPEVKTSDDLTEASEIVDQINLDTGDAELEELEKELDSL